MNELTTNQYQSLVNTIGSVLEQGRHRAVKSIDTILVETYWNIGKHIVEYEQRGNEKAEYGSVLLKRLSADLRKKYGKGFSRSNLQTMRLFYLQFPICQTLSGKLSWSHYAEIVTISDDLERSFYEKQCIRENWSVRELKRQKDSALFQRIALTRTKAVATRVRVSFGTGTRGRELGGIVKKDLLRQTGKGRGSRYIIDRF